MFALGLGVLFLGYTVTLYGYMLIKGYDVSFKQLFVGQWPPSQGSTGTAAGPATTGGAAPSSTGGGATIQGA